MKLQQKFRFLIFLILLDVRSLRRYKTCPKFLFVSVTPKFINLETSSQIENFGQGYKLVLICILLMSLV